jgi:two-component system chemotaxis sensor kinase CheA
MAKAPPSGPSLLALAERLEQMEAPDASKLADIHGELQRLLEDAPLGVSSVLKQALVAVTSVLEGRAPEPRATLTGAARLVKAVAPVESDAPPRARTTPPRTPTIVPAPTPTGFQFDEADRELIADFVVEALDYIEQAEAAMLVLQGTPGDMAAVDTVFRSFHTVKGVSAMLGLDPIAKLAHLAESLLSKVRSGELRFAGRIADLSLGSVDSIKLLVAGVQAALAGERWTPPDLTSLTAALSTETAAKPVSAPPPPAPPPPKRGAKPKTPKAPKGQLGAQAPEPPVLAPAPAVTKDPHPPSVTKPPVTAAALRDPAATPAEPPAAPSGPQAAAPNAATPQRNADNEASVRIRTERLDRLVDMVGELVIAHSMVRQDPSLVSSGHHDLSRKVAHAGKIVRELQELAMSLRMVPLKPTFQKMARVVRDTAQKSGKEVELVLSGEDTEIDRNMVDVVSDPLVHMLRNAVDHGIETPDEREAKGKRRAGTVRLSASHSGGNVVVELADDGAGLDRARIVKKAIERGLIESDAGLTDSEVYNLIFEPGFSTRDQVTDVSGRGVGMDVVRRNVQALHGRIEITSVLGQGTVFTLRLPLTLAVTDGMLVRVGAERYILPTVNILTSLRPTKDNVSTVSGKGELLVIRGELIPLFRLHQLFHVDNATSDVTTGLAVIVTGPDGRCALLVDELLGQQQVVAKSLGSGIGAVRGIAGGAILGDGRVGLILDTPELIALARDESTGRPTQTQN